MAFNGTLKSGQWSCSELADGNMALIASKVEPGLDTSTKKARLASQIQDSCIDTSELHLKQSFQIYFSTGMTCVYPSGVAATTS